MNIHITPRHMRNDRKVYYILEWGKKPGQRKASGIYTYTQPSTLMEREHNKEALRILTVKRAQLMLDWQAVGTGLIPMHRLEVNFLDCFADYVERNKPFDPHRLLLTLAQVKRLFNFDFFLHASLHV